MPTSCCHFPASRQRELEAGMKRTGFVMTYGTKKCFNTQDNSIRQVYIGGKERYTE